ncbi:MAG: type II restriction endonuclease [Prevotellaceae bacterium]|nr:type II restriction endonuclease [Prevotellaceae bacterium]
MERNFNIFFSQLQETNQTLDFFCDYEKISNHVNDIKLSLCMLNSLIGTTDLRKSIETIWTRDKSAFSIMDILIAVRSNGKKSILDSNGNCIILNRLFESVDGIIEYLEGTGLAEIFTEGKIKDLVDYVFGIETGLDSNARKNRSGHIMENMIADIFTKNGIAFRQEVYSTEWTEIQQALGDDKKRFDFVIKSASTTYLIEANFYNGGGSKLNEVARSFMEIAARINSVKGFEFIWITDGTAWKAAKDKLKEAYSKIPGMYNLTNITDFINGVKQDDSILL